MVGENQLEKQKTEKMDSKQKANPPLNEEAKHEICDGDQMYLNLQLSVTDTGVGISDEGIRKLFINFNKLKENSERNRSGTGLGLSICKHIIEQMGGSVDVRSQIGVGTTFQINIKTKCIVKSARIYKDKVPQAG